MELVLLILEVVRFTGSLNVIVVTVVVVTLVPLAAFTRGGGASLIGENSNESWSLRKLNELLCDLGLPKSLLLFVVVLLCCCCCIFSGDFSCDPLMNISSSLSSIFITSLKIK